MANTILLKRSSTASSAPTAGQLSAGELAINTLDEKIFFKNSSGTVKSLSAMSDLTSNLVTISTTQTISGSKTFSVDVTMTGDLAVNGGDITTTATGTATVFNTNATALNMGGVATSLTLGATASTTTTIRGGTLVGNTTTQNVFNATATTVNAFGAATNTYFAANTVAGSYFRFGSSAGTYLTTAAGTSVPMYIMPYGPLIIAPTTTGAIVGSLIMLTFTNSSAATGAAQFDGGDVVLGIKDDGIIETGVNLIFTDAFSGRTTLTASQVSAGRTITLPDADGTVITTGNRPYIGTTLVQTSSANQAVTGISSVTFSNSTTQTTAFQPYSIYSHGII